MKKSILPLAMTALVMAGTATAGTNTATITAESSIVPGCEVSVNNLNFGDVDLLGAAKTAQATATVVCTPGVQYTAHIVDVENPTNDQFKLKSAAGDEISLDIFSDSTRTTVWNSTSGVSAVAGDSSLGSTYTMYGRLPQQAAVPAGLYEAQFRFQVTY